MTHRAMRHITKSRELPATAVWEGTWLTQLLCLLLQPLGPLSPCRWIYK